MIIAKFDAVVIGAGIIGLACAKTLAEKGLETLVIERHSHAGEETSSRNSEVIHAGLYYPTTSLKAQLCVEGRRALYTYCDSHRVDYKRCKKIIVATSSDQEYKLDDLITQAKLNGVDDIQPLSRGQVHSLEPALHCTAGLLSTSTGIIDSHGLLQALLGDFQRAGGTLALQSTFLGAEIHSNGVLLEVESGGEKIILESDILINAAGLSSCAVAHQIRGLSTAVIPIPHYAKGSYFSYSGAVPFSHLIYPIPEPGGLGIHLTLDLAGQARFGPDVEWIDHLDYQVDNEKSTKFCTHIRSYWPSVRPECLTAGYAGIRPKISGPNEANADFVIQDHAVHGIKGLINLFGIESPGLTASLAIAQHVVAQVSN